MSAHEKRVSDQTVCTLSVRGMLRCAGENHISIAPDLFLDLHGQAEIHMYSCYMLKQLVEKFLAIFQILRHTRRQLPGCIRFWISVQVGSGFF